ncbi:hypothetical protein ElyMa_005931400 [Elysia marginata]|uniref:Uncharacterized protein n=1 Tax=Elysia marginata TaxID=1093978 RepID=A0AAV4G8A7_9GAST|nr:hypothetical protein ElyMa_005931400 [Elysia marginata]
MGRPGCRLIIHKHINIQPKPLTETVTNFKRPGILTPAKRRAVKLFESVDETPSFTNTYSDTGRDTATTEDGGQPPTTAEFSSIVEEKMLKLWSETKEACPLDRNSRKINVLMFTETMYEARDDPLISIKLPGELRMSSGARPIHKLYSQGRQQLQISILAACFLSISVFCFTHSFLLSSQES